VKQLTFFTPQLIEPFCCAQGSYPKVTLVTALSLLKHRSLKTPSSEAELIKAVISGDREAQRVLYLTHAPSVARVVRNATGDCELTKDIVQDTFVKGFLALHQLTHAEALKSWLTQIALSLAQKHFRREKLKRLFGFESASALSEEIVVPNHVRLDASVELEQVLKVVNRMTFQQKNAWLLRHLEEWSLIEIATSLDCSLASVKRYVAAAETKIQSHLKDRHE
jgi:RNA polymerase sigma-70 factor, ECF subfamily